MINKSASTEIEQFNLWMVNVNAAIISRCGLDSNDLPDFCYRDAFDDEATPKQAAVAAIHAAKDY